MEVIVVVVVFSVVDEVVVVEVIFSVEVVGVVNKFVDVDLG